MDKRVLILKTTTETIAHEGVNGSPMSQIAKKAGVAVGTIYHHFGSKEEIINEIYVSIRKRVGDVIVKNAQGHDSYKEEFKSVSFGMYNYYAEHPTEFTFLLQVDHSPIITPEIHKECELYFSPVFEFYKKGMEQDFLIKMDLMVMGMLTYNIIITLVELNIKGYEITTEKLDEAIEFSWRGISKPI